MAHFAKLGLNGKVIQVLSLNDGDMLNADGVEDETVGQQYLERNPYASWVKHIETASWKSPIGDPPELTQEQKNDNFHYQWNEENQNWNLTNT